MLTDADFEDAYRELTRPSRQTVVGKCLGDFVMVFGGAFLGTLQSSYCSIGIVFIVVGLYVREYSGTK